MKIGFIGVGVMGKSMVYQLVNHGFEVEVYARNLAKIQDVLEKGIKKRDSIKELVLNNDVIITIVGYPSDVEDVYFSKDKIFDNARRGQIVIDMTTSSPTLAKKIHDEFKKIGVEILDSPVTGGDIGAKNGTLTIFVGGNKEAYEKCLPLFEAMGTCINYVGEAGNGQHAKLANQISIAGAISAMAETITYAQKNGLDVLPLINAWSSGSAGSWQMKNMAPRALNGDMNPGFFIKHFIKDMRLAKEEAAKLGLDLKMLNTVLDMFIELAKKEGYEDLGTQAILDYYKEN